METELIQTVKPNSEWDDLIYRPHYPLISAYPSGHIQVSHSIPAIVNRIWHLHAQTQGCNT